MIDLSRSLTFRVPQVRRQHVTARDPILSTYLGECGTNSETLAEIIIPYVKIIGLAALGNNM